MKPSYFLLPLSACLLAAALTSCRLIGPVLNAALPLAGAKIAFSCMPEDARIDTPSGPRCVQNLTAGDVVTGHSGKPVRILQKHVYMESPATVFLQLSFSDGAAVELCGMHRVAGIRARDIRVGQTIEGRTVTVITSRTGESRSCDLLTEDAGYRIDGIPVNSMIEEMLAAASGRRPVMD